MKPERLKSQLEKRARSLGFDTCRVTNAHLPDETGNRLAEFVANNHHGTMEWMETTLERRRTPTAMWPQAKTAIMLGMNYGPDHNPLDDLKNADRGTISVYARNRDYHDVIKGRLKELAGWLASATKGDVKVFVDTAPLMEKPLAGQAGMGWQGKHTNLVSRHYGSWLFIGSILATATLEPDEPETDHCGSCRACLDVCPTDAFPAPYRLDARKCISYLTIEHAGMIPLAYRKAMGNRIYGCDDCLAVCPWNKYARTAREQKLVARPHLMSPRLEELASLDEPAFRALFSGSPIKRIGRNRFIRNVLVAIGNSGDGSLAKSAKLHLEDRDAVIRASAVWALSRLEEPSRFADMRHLALQHEADETVIQEWNRNDP